MPPPPQRTPRQLLFVLFPLFFLSGASSLIFEILWQRKMMFVFGASAPAITAILTAFFLGIALGSWIGGRLLSRWQHRISPLRFYAVTEVWIGVFGVAVPLLLMGVDRLYLAAFDTQELTQPFSFFYRFLMSVAVVLPASSGMGATVPIMACLIHQYGPGIGRSVGFAYGVNAAGAVVGCLATGFLLLEQLGLRGSLLLASSLNAVVVISALVLSRSRDADAAAPVAEPAPSGFRPREWAFIGIYLITSMVAIGLEVLWFRMLAIFNTGSLTTFTVGLGIYLAGFSFGSLLLYPLLERVLSGVRIFFLASLGAAFASLVSFVQAQDLTNWCRAFTRQLEQAVPFEIPFDVLSEVGNALWLMFVPTLFLGLAFPAVCQAISNERSSVSWNSGLVYFVGNIGAALGAALTGLAVIPQLGLIGTAAAFVVVLAVMAAWTMSLDPIPAGRRVLQAGCALLVGIAFYTLLDLAPWVRGGTLTRDGQHWRVGNTDTKLIRYRAGASGTVMVHELRGGQRKILIDDKPVASTLLHARIDAKMLAHIPLMLHPEPERALTVGFGSGGTSWSMTTYGIQTDVAEIEPEVVASAALFWNQNHRVLDSPNLRVILNDARNYLYATQQKYDVISTDATNLEYKQNASLYTREYFQLMKDRLTPDGIACVWLPLGGTGFPILLRTFQDVFPHASTWFLDHTFTAFAILIGTPGPLTFDHRVMRERFGIDEVRRDLKEIGILDPFQLIHFVYLDDEGMRAFTGSGPLHTDDHPVLEFQPLPGYDRGAHLGDRVVQMRALKPRDLTSRIVNLRAEDLPQLEKFRTFSERWGDFIVFNYFAPRDDDETRFLERAVGMIHGALEIVPDYPYARRNLRAFEKWLSDARAGR